MDLPFCLADSSVDMPAHLEPWNPSLSGDAVCSYVANGSDFLYNIHKDYGEKGVLIRK